MKVYRRYSPTIMDGAVIRWYFNPKPFKDVFGNETMTGEGQVSASRNGVIIQGVVPTIDTEEALSAMETLLHEAWQVHERLRRAVDVGEWYKKESWVAIDGDNCTVANVEPPK